VKRTADVVIIGAGVMGASVAWHLAALGCTNVIVLDKEPVAGNGSTGRATGGFRTQFASPINVALSLLSRDKLRRFRDETGGDCGYEPVGYLFLARDDAQLAILERAISVQRNAGLLESELIGVAEIARRNPAIVLDDVRGGSFGATDGYIRPLGILRGYLDAAIRAGVVVEYAAAPTRLRTEGGRITEVETSAGSIVAGAVVNAAGCWADVVADLAGVALAVTPVRRQVALTVPTAALPPDMPMTIFASDGYHLRVRDGRVLLLWPADTIGASRHDITFDPAWLQGVVSRTRARVPVLRDVAIDFAGCWCGLYEMSPDHHAIVGAAPGLDNFFLMNGSSGHGVMHAPALGQLLAEVILHGRAGSLDISALRPTRFLEGAPNPAPVLL
jgi:sarcosine oxidase subunit beta